MTAILIWAALGLFAWAAERDMEWTLKAGAILIGLWLIWPS